MPDYISTSDLDDALIKLRVVFAEMGPAAGYDDLEDMMMDYANEGAEPGERAGTGNVDLDWRILDVLRGIDPQMILDHIEDPNV